MGKKRAILPDYRAVAFDETKYYRIDPEDKKHIKAIYGVYIYNKNEHVYVAEMTPSYWLEPLYTTIDFDSDVYDNERLLDRLDGKYAHEPMEGTYMHVSDLDNYVNKNPKRAARYGKAKDIEIVREYWQGNPPL